ncbi:uncharacterized protein LOC127847976 [Dreissena polymorpha]|uniref:DZIP3-like HEPN domain-containing protein n=1 Tax=Dreissena polymorpha TaxID=45954 RepID=A0A9D4DEJ8_DREPO|nr:uncharacterized protein LOC127847976 [Dreissena polymorpha]KAH3747899.1 hypothetical protein DPMN_182334 [Dreissena polymorpha]
MASVDGNQKEAYFVRLMMLLKEAEKVLRAKFDSIIKPVHLTSTLMKAHGTIRKLKDDGFISMNQYKLLNPNPKSENFDITLLACLLRNICNLNPKDKVWNEKENSSIKGNSDQANVQRILNLRNLMSHKPLALLEQHEFDEHWHILELAMIDLGSKCGLVNIKTTVSNIKTKRWDLETCEMKSLRENTKWFLEKYQKEDQFYVKTNFWNQANTMLTEKHIIILTGNPGEGKTTMAAYLALERSKPEKCLKLAHANDWRKVDWSLGLFNTVIIDDIFGARALDSNNLSEWRPFLQEIERAAKQEKLNVILTSRRYIIEEAFDELNTYTNMFKDEVKNCVHLTSNDLTDSEKKDILVQQARLNGKEDFIKDHSINIDECVLKSKGTHNTGIDREQNFVFGFPECANLFVTGENIMKLGARFFESPESHFKTYVEQLYNSRDEDMFHKFLSLVLVWAEQSGRIKEDDILNASVVSEHIKHVASIFGIEINHRFIENIKVSLQSHQNDFLIHIGHSGEYVFSHNVVGDMVGVVLGQQRHKPVETIKLCSRDFLMDRVVLHEDDSNNNAFRVVVGKANYEHLCKRVADMILRNNCNHVNKKDNTDDFKELQRGGQRSNKIEVVYELDFGILKHKMFTNEVFVNDFIQFIKNEKIQERILQTPVMKMKGYFLHYGIQMNEMTMCVPGYLLYSGMSIFAKRLIEESVIQKDSNATLLLAAHSGDTQMLELLISKGAKVTGDTVYVAMHNSKTTCLQAVMRGNTAVNDNGNIVNGNYPIIVASRKGLNEAVTCMLKNGANPSLQNEKNMTALHIAVLYNRASIVKELLEHGAQINRKNKKYQRTPLHIAADKGHANIVQYLLEKGADINSKDCRGHYPIFLAAICGHVSTVKVFLKHNKQQDQMRVKSYGTKSLLKGMSLYHVAVWKNNKKMIQMLIEENADVNVKDFFGQTPLFYAIMSNKKRLVNMLLTRADQTIAQKQGFTPLHAAIFKGNTELASKLCEKGDVNRQDKYGRTPLHVACEKGNIRMVNLLLNKCNADAHLVTKRKDTVFHILRRKRPNQDNKDHCKRRLIERMIQNKDPTVFDELKIIKNKSGVCIDKMQKLTAADEKQIKKLEKALLGNFENADITVNEDSATHESNSDSDDDDNDDYQDNDEDNSDTDFDDDNDDDGDDGYDNYEDDDNDDYDDDDVNEDDDDDDDDDDDYNDEDGDDDDDMYS